MNLEHQNEQLRLSKFLIVKESVKCCEKKFDISLECEKNFEA